MQTSRDLKKEQFRNIDIEFLKVEATEFFDIYYKTKAFGTTRFVKFASSHPSHHEKVLRFIESIENNEEFFIREEDLFKYYQQATKFLRAMISNQKIPLNEKTKKIYDVSKGVMKEFFENNISEKILQSSEEVMSIMEQCLSENDAGLPLDDYQQRLLHVYP